MKNDWFYFTFYYVNTILNPDQPHYKSYYLEDTAYVTFGSQIGVESYLYVSDYDISTDFSIWPFSNIIQDKGFMTNSMSTSHPYSLSASTQANYVTFGIAKSSKSTIFNRSVQKISIVFSFMGGLIGVLLAGMFIINSYTSFAFEISIAMEVFQKKQIAEG